MNQQSARYVLSELILTQTVHRLYKGEDLILRRPVLIYAIPLVKSVESYRQSIEHAAPGFSNPPFLHILDMQLHAHQLDVILDHKPGQPLGAYLQTSRPTPEQSMALLLQFGQAWKSAEEEAALPVVSLTVNNLWITADGQLYAINTWEPRVDDHERSVSVPQALGLLFYHLIIRNAESPVSEDSLETELRWSMPDCPPAKLDDIIAVMRNVRHGQLTLTALLGCLTSWLEEGPLSLSGSSGHPRGDLPGERQARAPLAAKPISDWRPAVETSPSHEDLSGYSDEEMEEEEEEEPALSRKSRLARFARKAAWGVSISVASLLVFAGVLMVLINWIDLKGSGSKKDIPLAQDQLPQSTPTGKPTPSSSATPTPTPSPPAPPAAIVQVPSLTGKNRQDAEKTALDSGLRYTYFLEPNDGAPGTVFKQDPQPNEQVARGTRVTFWVNKPR